jgi:hypothetical protein
MRDMRRPLRIFVAFVLVALAGAGSYVDGFMTDFAALRRFYRAAADNGQAVLLALT